MFSLDIRSLALFRIALGAILFVSVLTCWSNHGAFFGPEGLLTRIDPPDKALPQFRGFSLLASISPHLGFAVLAGTALALAIGWHARLAAFAAWLLVISLNAHNPLIINSGDKLLALLLFWAWLLPINAFWSLDAYRGRAKAPGGRSVLSAATAGLFLQGFFLYFSAFLYKLQSSSWTSGYHLTEVLNRLDFIRPFGAWMGGLEELHPWMTGFVLVLQGVGALLLFAPSRHWRLRTGLVAAFTLLQIGMGLSLFIGVFPLVAVCALIGHLPTGLWDRLEAMRPVSHDARRSASQYTLSPFPPPSWIWAVDYAVRRTTQIVGSSALVLLVLANYNDHVRIFDNNLLFETAVSTLNLQQGWRMFSAHTHDGKWYVAEARLANGETVDLLRNGSPVDWEMPRNFVRHLPSRYWRKLICETIHHPRHTDKREAVLCLIVDQWNRGACAERQVIHARLVELRYRIARGNYRGDIRWKTLAERTTDARLAEPAIHVSSPGINVSTD